MGASRGRHAATPDGVQPPSPQASAPVPDARPRGATVRAPFASRGSGVQIPSAPPVSAGQRSTKCLKLVSLGNNGEPIADLSAAGGLTCALSGLSGAPSRGRDRSCQEPAASGRQRAIALGQFPAYPARGHPLGPRRRGCRQPLRPTRTARTRQPAIRQLHPAGQAGLPPRSARCRQDSNWSLCLSRPRNEHPGRNRSRIPSKATGSARLPARQLSAPAPRPRKTSPGNVLLRGCKGRQLAHKAEDTGLGPARRAEPGRAVTPSPGCGPLPGRHIQTAGHDP